MASEDFKDLNKRPSADKALHDKVSNIAKNPKDCASYKYIHFLLIMFWAQLFSYSRYATDKQNKKGFKLLLCLIDIYSKYAWVILLKDQRRIAITNAFQKVLDELNCKPNKTSVDKSIEFYNRLKKLLLEKNDLEMYSTQNEGKYVVAERFMRTLKNKIYKYMDSVSKNV